MYPLLCAGGYPIPIKVGKFRICGVSALINDVSATARLTLVDSDSFSVETDDQTLKPVICDLKSIATADPMLTIMFEEPIPMRDGVTIGSATANIIAGRTMVYVQ